MPRSFTPHGCRPVLALSPAPVFTPVFTLVFTLVFALVFALAGCGTDQSESPARIVPTNEASSSSPTPAGASSSGPVSPGSTSSDSGGSGSGGCGTPPFRAGNWPPSCYQRFTGSPFDRPLPDDTAYLRRNSRATPSHPADADVANLTADPTGAGGDGSYYSRPGDPLFTLRCVHDPYGRPDHGCPIDGMRIRIPAGARPGGNRAIVVGQPRTTDTHLIVVDQRSGWEYDLWQLQSTSSFTRLSADRRTVIGGLSARGGTVVFSWGGRLRLSGDGTSRRRPADEPVDDANAAHWAESQGRVRIEDLQAGRIDHALALNLPCVSSAAPVYPADTTGRGRACGNGVSSPLGSYPLGTRLWLDLSDAQINGLSAPAWKKIFLRALAHYGAFVGDTDTTGDGTPTRPRLFAIETEGGNMYSSLADGTGRSYPDPWYAWAGQQGWPVCDSSACLPGVRVGKLYADGSDTADWGAIWSRLRVLDSCVTPAPGRPGCRGDR